MRLTAQVGEFEMDEVILDLGSEVNVLTKQTWEQMGNPKLARSPIHLRLANHHWVDYRKYQLISTEFADL